MAFSFCQQARSAEAFLFHKLPSFKVERTQIFFGCALPLSVLEKPDKMPARYVRFKIFPAGFFGVHFSARPAVRTNSAVVRRPRPRQPCQPVRQRPPSAPAVHAPASVSPPALQPAPVHASRPRQPASVRVRAHAPDRADSCQPSARARSRPRRLNGIAAPYMVDCPPVTY